MLESFYEVARERVAELMRAAIALATIATVDPVTLLRALEIYELDRLDFAEAYLVAASRGHRSATRSSPSTARSTASRSVPAASRNASPRRSRPPAPSRALQRPSPT